MRPIEAFDIQRTLGDLGRAEAGLNEDISALGSESGRDSLGEGVDTSEERGAGLNTELDVLVTMLE